MLKSSLPYSTLITVFYNNKNTNTTFLLEEQDWLNCLIISELLEPFYNATKQLSGVFYPTSNLLLINIWNITSIFAKYRYQHNFNTIIAKLEQKFNTYWKIPPMWCCLASVMDPRYRLDYVHAVVDDICNNTNQVDKINEINENIKNRLQKVFKEYESIYGTNSASSSRTSTNPLWSRLQSNKEKYIRTTTSNELELYLDSTIVFTNEDLEKLDVLEWWSQNASRYPIVSRIAKDLLTIPASTVASESAFSAGKRVITDRRSRLSDESVEASVCLKDWYDAEDRATALKIAME